MLVAPGGNSNAEVPLVKYAMLAAQRRGAQVRQITWRLSGDRGGFSGERERVASQFAAAFVPGRLASSAAVLGQIAAAVEDFFVSVVWC